MYSRQQLLETSDNSAIILIEDIPTAAALVRSKVKS
jgi:hypothetical protein